MSLAINNSELKAFPELRKVAIFEFEVVNIPVTVAADSKGEYEHQTGRQIRQAKIEDESIKIV